MNELEYELLESLKSLMKLIDDGILVRETKNDHDPFWAVKQIPLVQTLHRAQTVLAKAEIRANEERL